MVEIVRWNLSIYSLQVTAGAKLINRPSSSAQSKKGYSSSSGSEEETNDKEKVSYPFNYYDIATYYLG